MTAAREIMTTEVAFASNEDSIREAARKMAEFDVGMLPVCDADRRLGGTITDRDIALRVVGEGRDPGTTKVADVATNREVVTIGADDSIEEALATMKRYAVRRLPVIDGNTVVGIVAQADIATSLSGGQTGEVVEAISQARPDQS